MYETLLKQGQHIVPFSFTNKIIRTSDFSNGKFFHTPYPVATMASMMNPFSRSLHGQMKKHIDLLHVTDHMLPKLNDIPVVSTICDSIMFKHAPWGHKTLRLSNLKKWLRKKTLPWANHYITISNTMLAELVEHLDIKEEKISVIYLGISRDWFFKASAEKKQTVLKKFGLPNQFLLFTGTLQPKKNLPRTIRAYLQLPSDIQDEYPLVIVGRPGWHTKESLTAINDLITRKKGYWLNYVPLPELQVLFQCATLYLHPSLHEGFGLTLLEAFASRTPTITSHATALPEIANGAAYLIDPYSELEIHSAIKTVLTSKNMQSELIEKGLIRAKEFTWEKCAKETLSVYQSLL